MTATCSEITSERNTTNSMAPASITTSGVRGSGFATIAFIGRTP